MISGKDVRIENGYIIINGEKYPIVQDVSEIEGEIEDINTDLTEAIAHTLIYLNPAEIDADVLARGGIVAHTQSFFSIKNGRVGLGICIDTGESNNYLIALLYRTSLNEKVKFVEIAKNGLYINETNDQGTAAITGNTGTREAYTIVFY